MLKKYKLIAACVCACVCACVAAVACYAYAQHRISKAEQFMSSYWVRQQTQGLEPVLGEDGEPIHTPEYRANHRWIVIRDFFHTGD